MTVAKLSLLMIVTALAGAIVGLEWASWRPHARTEPDRRSESVGDFALLDQDGRFHRLYRNATAKAVVLYSHGLGCTAVRDSLPALREIRDAYATRGVEFLLINANPQDRRSALKREAQATGLEIPILKDDAQLVSEALGLARTAEAIVLDTATWSIRYRGPIDDRLYVGGQRGRATHHYLAEALDRVLDGELEESTQVSTIGCLIARPDTPADHPVSYAREVAPILREKCVNCHRAGGVAPWAMDRYETIAGWAPMIREVIMTRRMPPWHADPEVGNLLADGSLSIDEQRTLARWTAAGAPRDGASDPLLANPPVATDGRWALGEPDLVIEVPEQRIPAHGLVPYRWVRVPVPIAADRWVRAVQLRPSEPGLVHHAFVLVQYPARQDRAQPEWEEGRNGFFGAYVPGFDLLPMPEDSGQLLPYGTTLVFQLHYITVGRRATDRPRLGLYFHRTPPAREYVMQSAANLDIRIPPEVTDHEEQAEAVLEEDALLYAFYPHMHYRGSRFRYEARYPDGHSEPLLSVPSYSFGWQNLYRLAEPKWLPAGTRIRAVAGFDNSALNPANPDPSQEVHWGLRDLDEMLVGYFMYTRERGAAPGPRTTLPPKAGPAGMVSRW